MHLLRNHLQSLIQSIKLLVKGKFLVFFIPGILVSFFFFILVNIIHFIFGLLDYAGEIPWVGSSLRTGLAAMDTWSEVGLIYILQFFILTLLSPFNTVLSERIENEVTGSTFKSTWEQIIKDIIRMIGILLIGLVIDIFLFILWDLTLANLFNLDALTPVYLLIINSFWFGFTFYDFSLERHKISSKNSYKFALNRFGYMILTGALFTLLLRLPFFGVAIGSVLMTAVATLNFLAIQQNSKRDSSGSLEE